MPKNAMFSVEKAGRHRIYLLVPSWHGRLAVPVGTPLETAPWATPDPARLRLPEPARADVAGDGRAGRRAGLPEDDDRADREDGAGGARHLLRALRQQGRVLSRRLRRERRGR